MDKRDMIQIRLKYGSALYIYGNVNNMDIFCNIPAILKIASFFDTPSPDSKSSSSQSKLPPSTKSSSSSSSRQTPQLFSILSYLYTVHPSLTIDNTHLYFPSDASDLDAAMMIVSIPMIQLRGTKEWWMNRLDVKYDWSSLHWVFFYDYFVLTNLYSQLWLSPQLLFNHIIMFFPLLLSDTKLII